MAIENVLRYALEVYEAALRKYACGSLYDVRLLWCTDNQIFYAK